MPADPKKKQILRNVRIPCSKEPVACSLFAASSSILGVFHTCAGLGFATL